MAFLNDLDAWAWAGLLAAIVVFGSVMFVNLQDWRDRRRIEIFDGRGTLILFFGGVFVFGAISSYSPNAHAPRKTVEGVARFVGETSGRGGYYKFICATSCRLTGGYALSLHDEAARVTRIGSEYDFTYLERPVGNVWNGISLRVIAVSEAGSGRVLWALDLTNHLYRIAAYLLDFALVVCAGLLSVPMNRSRHYEEPDKNDCDEDEQGGADRRTRESEPISLGLDSKDAS
jgi:hypothetical protein